MEDIRKVFFRKFLQRAQKHNIERGKTPANTAVSLGEHCAFRPKGFVTIEAIYPDGKKEILLDEEENLVVQQAETIMPYMALAQRQLDYIELGDPSPATPASFSDTNLQQSTGERKSITANVQTNMVTCEATWATSEGNGYNFTESGLFTDPFGTGLMFARKVFSSITKTNAFSLKFTWALVFQLSSQAGGLAGISLIGPATVSSDFAYISPAGGETDVIIPIDFTVAAKQLDVFFNSARLAYNIHYYETTIGPTAKGIAFIGFSLIPGDLVYIVHRKLA